MDSLKTYLFFNPKYNNLNKNQLLLQYKHDFNNINIIKSFNDFNKKYPNFDIEFYKKINLIDGTKKVKLYPGHDKVEVPIIEKESAQVLSISGKKANIMDMKTYETFDINIPEEFKEQIKEGDQVTYWIILGEKILKQK